MRSVKFCVKCELKFWKNALQIGDAINFWHYARNFSYTLVKSQDGQYGNCAKPTNCSGIIGMVQRNEVDFAIGLRQI